MTTTPEGSGYLLHNLLLFGRLLRSLGLDVNLGRMITLVQALDHVEIGHKSDFYHAARCLLVYDHSDLPVFDEAFDLFWRRPEKRKVSLQFAGSNHRQAKSSDAGATRPAISLQSSPEVMESPVENDESNPDFDLSRTYSSQEFLRHKNFAELDSDEMDAIQKLIIRLVWQLGQRRTRRYRPGRGLNIDMRRSLRRSLRYGGEIFEWSYRKPKVRPRPLVIIADISGSMERYTRLLLHFVYSLTRGLDQSVEAFVFSTRLTRITRQLTDHEIDRAMMEVTQMVPDWSGGTRIGETIRRFNYDWARRVLGRGAVLLLISDGWDRGDPKILTGEMARLQRSCYRLIWLNPLLGSPGYEPLTRGMMAALPYIDDFLPVHNLASLESLAHHIEQLEERRPSRRQQIGLSSAI